MDESQTRWPRMVPIAVALILVGVVASRIGRVVAHRWAPLGTPSSAGW